jgi:DNA-binding NarL/FixJ family response regulator
MNVLIIDDSDYKIKSLKALLAELDFISDVFVAKSFHSGIRALAEIKPQLVLLDMTLPTSERADGRLEGRTRIYGGREILMEMEEDRIDAKVIVVTQFDHFGEPPNSIDLKTLLTELHDQYPTLFVGGVYYSNVDARWRDNLRETLNRMKSDLK